MRPPRTLVPIGVEHSYQCHDSWPIEAVYTIIVVILLVPNVQMELLRVCRPFFMVIVLQLPLFLYELQWSLVCADDRFLPQNVMLPLTVGLHNGMHLFVVSGVLSDYV